MEKKTWEQQTIEKLLLQTYKEQRRARLHKIFWRLVIIACIIFAYFTYFDNDKIKTNKEKQIAVINFQDEINRDNNSYDNFATSLDNALTDINTKAIIIRANSPGGSPVYSDMINQEIYRQKLAHPKTPIIFAIEEVCASGCYYAAVAADKIYAQPASIVGSIGVISPQFGVDKLMDKLGVENRLLTAGKYKAMGYPFSAQNPDVTKIQQQMLNDIQQQFIQAVKKGRPHLSNNPDLFTGRYWIGSQAESLGLIDGYATVDSIARDQFGSTNLVDFTIGKDTLSVISKKLGVDMANSAKNAVISSMPQLN